MGVPKRRTSRSRRGNRRAHDRLDPPAVSVCPKCKTTKLPHRICPSCGTYGDRVVIESSEE